MFYALLCAMLGIIGCAITLYFLSHGGIEEEPPFMDSVPETNARPLDGNPIANARTIEPNDTHFPWSDVQRCRDAWTKNSTRPNSRNIVLAPNVPGPRTNWNGLSFQALSGPGNRWRDAPARSPFALPAKSRWNSSVTL